nr:late embryogenesis abundant protein LEA30 [Pinus tabuliformis]
MAMESGKNRRQYFSGPQGKRGRSLLLLGGLGTIVVLGLAVLITWLALKLEKPKYDLEYGSVSQFQISHDGLVNSKFFFNITTRNPNKKVAIYYDNIDAFLLYDDEEIAWASIPPFFQGDKNTTSLYTPLSGYSVSLQPGTSRDLKLEHSSGKVDLVLRLYARIRFKRGNWKSRHYTLSVKCRHLVLDLADKGDTVGRMKCHVHV